jgi:N-dimethylarginine dimethylaminohydrolase
MLCYSVDSEYKPLRAVLLSRPCPEMGRVARPQDVLYSARVDYALIKKESEVFARLCRKFKIRAAFLDPRKQKKTGAKYVYNLLFTRDHFFMTPAGAILSRMAHVVRRDEVVYARKALNAAGVIVRKTIDGRGTFEGADALWVTDKLVVLGVGNRTNLEGFRQVKKELSRDGIECVRVLAPRGTLHLLGALQIVDNKLALARAGQLDLKIISLLKGQKINIISIPENTEVIKKHAMNFVTIGPGKVMMASGCPVSRRIFERAGIKIAAEAPAFQLAHAGGGLACAAGILARF